MIALFKVPKTAIGKARKKGRKLTAPRKKKAPDKDYNGIGVSRVPVSWRGDSLFPVSRE